MLTKEEFQKLISLYDNNTISKEQLNLLEPYRVRRAIFIAAGFGSRMKPVTLHTPKPMVEVHGKRIIDTLIDACLRAGINEIYVVRGYLGEQFDRLSQKYPMIKFIDNKLYEEANNISSVLLTKDLLSNAYVMEADLYLTNQDIITKYHYHSDFLAIATEHTDDWCFVEKNGVIVEEKVGGEHCWQMVGISYWNEEDGKKLAEDIQAVFETIGGKSCYWEQVPLAFCKDHYTVEIKECFETDIVEIDTFEELVAMDHSYSTYR